MSRTGYPLASCSPALLASVSPVLSWYSDLPRRELRTGKSLRQARPQAGSLAPRLAGDCRSERPAGEVRRLEVDSPEPPRKARLVGSVRKGLPMQCSVARRGRSRFYFRSTGLNRNGSAEPVRSGE